MGRVSGTICDCETGTALTNFPTKRLTLVCVKARWVLASSRGQWEEHTGVKQERHENRARNTPEMAHKSK